jgi:uncharacterized protein
MSERLMFNCTYGKEAPERATLPFVAANVAATVGQEAVVVCTIDAVWLGTEGGSDGIQSSGLPKLSDLFAEFVRNGGEVWLCGACTNPPRHHRGSPHKGRQNRRCREDRRGDHQWRQGHRVRMSAAAWAGEMASGRAGPPTL